jgi:hypothetical protein
MSFIPDPGEKLMAMVVNNDGNPRIESFRHGTDVDTQIGALLGELHAEDGAEVELVTADSVDELLAAHTAETQEAIGQLTPTDADETPVKPAKAPRKTPKANAGAKKAATKTKAPAPAKVSDAPVDVKAHIAACALNGSGGALAAAMFAAAR